MAVVEFVKEGRIAHIILNRPEAMNALNSKFFKVCGMLFTAFRDDDELW